MAISLVIVIGLSLFNIDTFAQEATEPAANPQPTSPAEGPKTEQKADLNLEPRDNLGEQIRFNTVDNGQDGWVEVEPMNLLPSDITGVYLLIPYRNRRAHWSQVYNIGFSNYRPSNYEVNFIEAPFTDIYATPDTPLVEIQAALKRNFSFGSIGAELGVGTYKNSSDTDDIESELTLHMVRLGLNLNLDNITYEPFVVPYISGGGYVIFYEETVASTGFSGNTMVAPYYAFGLSFQLNWLDRESARVSYMDYGVENTFLYAEIRKFMKSSVENDPDFSTAYDWGAGVKMEF